MTNWTRKSYDAVFNYANPAERANARATLLADGLHDVVERLESGHNLGIWYAITREAVDALGYQIIRESAKQAENELNKEVGS